MTALEQTEWKIHFCCVKAHDRILGNKLDHTLANVATTNLDIAECYNSVPKSIVKCQLEERIVDKCKDTKSELTNKKDYFHIVAERVKIKLTTTHNFTTTVTGKGNIKAYLYFFKISEIPTC